MTIDESATSRAVSVLRVELGPLRLAYYPDGDDPGVGAIELQVDEAKARTPFVVPIETWREITRLAARSARLA